MMSTARTGGPFRNHNATSLRFGLREIEEGGVAGRYRQRSTQLELDRMANRVCGSTRQSLKHSCLLSFASQRGIPWFPSSSF